MELLLNHSHTDLSNEAEQEVRDFPAINHQVNYGDLIEGLDGGDSVAVAGTEHWRINDYSELERYVESRGGAVERYDTHIAGELDETEFAAFYGVEGSLETYPQHFTASGVDISEVDKDRDFVNMDEDELYDLARQSAWITPAHPYLPGFSLEDENMDLIMDMDEDPDIDVMLPYTEGYNKILNGLAQGRHRENNVEEVADDRNLSVVPEADLHCYVPHGLAGFGLTEGVVEDAREGEISLDKIREADVITEKGTDIPFNLYRSGQSFADQLPGYDSGLYRQISFVPTSEEDFQDIWESSLDNLVTDREDVEERVKHLS